MNQFGSKIVDPASLHKLAGQIIIIRKQSQPLSELTGELLQMLPHRIQILGHTFQSDLLKDKSREELVDREVPGGVTTDPDPCRKLHWRSPPAISNEG